MTESAEQRELSLVGKVELRIALVETDSKLEATLKTYLPPLLLKLASEHLTVRNKVSGNRAKRYEHHMFFSSAGRRVYQARVVSTCEVLDRS